MAKERRARDAGIDRIGGINVFVQYQIIAGQAIKLSPIAGRKSMKGSLFLLRVIQKLLLLLYNFLYRSASSRV
jgi:hypothetical protein